VSRLADQAVQPVQSVADALAAPPPGLKRRLASLLYESILVFAVLMIATLVFSVAIQQRHALQWRWATMSFLALVIAAYFIWCWRRSGQTLAMQTWHLRLVREDGQPLTLTRAVLRHLSGYVWVLPPLALIAANGARDVGVAGSIAILLAWVVGYALTALAHPQRQFWHDAWCGTRQVTWKNR
jgi:uncharacterized RDD family membrane protein YckC